MSYSISALSTVSDCDQVLLSAQNTKSSLEVRKTNIVFRQNNFASNSSEVESDLTMVEAQLAATNTIIDALPEGDEKQEQITKKMGLEYRQRILQRRMISYGVVGQLERENDLALIELQIAEMNAFILAVEERKAQL